MVTEARKKWYTANADRLRSEARTYRQRNIETYRQRDKNRQIRIKAAVLCHYSGGLLACSMCPENRLAALTIDHINGGGKQHRAGLKLPGGWVFCRWLQKQGYPDGYRVLCSNCNWRHHLSRITANLSTTKKAVQLRQWKLKIKRELMDKLGGRCGIADIEILTIHHANNDGAAHRKSLGSNPGSNAVYNSILRSGDLTGLECLCFSCNDALEWSS